MSLQRIVIDFAFNNNQHLDLNNLFVIVDAEGMKMCEGELVK